MSDITTYSNIEPIYIKIKDLLIEARTKAVRTINTIMVQTYWNIGKAIIEEEQKGKEPADYGTYLLKGLSIKLQKEFGQGFTETNLKYMRQFYTLFPIRHSLSDKLT